MALEHRGLIDVAGQMVNELTRFRERLTPDGPTYWHHYEFCERAEQLAGHLIAARMLTTHEMYPSAFTVLRTGLEHHVIDRLLFSGLRHARVFKNVDPYELKRLQEAVETKKPWAETIESISEDDGKVTVVYGGLSVRPSESGDDGYRLSIYYSVLEDHAPFIGPARHQRHFSDGTLSGDEREDYARRIQRLHHDYLRWESLKKGWELNGFMTEDDLVRLDVHYRFLSAYTHATKSGYERVGPAYDHYASELALLYIIVLACRELLALLVLADQTPTVEIAARSELEHALGGAAMAAAHLWFPGGSPWEFDFVTEANQRAFDAMKDAGSRSASTPSPADLSADEVRYYADPLTRLTRLHGSFQEMTTGFTYRSPWERPDARTRRH